MAYILFLLKKIRKFRMGYLPLVLIVLVCLGQFLLGSKLALQENSINYRKQTIISLETSISQQEQILKSLDEDSIEFQNTKRFLDDSKGLLENNKQLIKDFQEGNWKSFYTRQLKELQQEAMTTASQLTDRTTKKLLEEKIKLYQYLLKNCPPYEEFYAPITGLRFSLSLFRYILPVLLPFSLAFVLSNLYGSLYHGKIDKTRLLPITRAKIILSHLTVGSLYALVVFLGVFGLVFGVATAFFGTGNLAYPALFHRLGTGELYFSGIGQTILPTLLLHALSLVFMVSVIYLISCLFRNRMTSLFVSTLVLLAGVILPMVVAPLYDFAHIIPTAYVRSFDIVTGVFQESISNYKLTVGTGLAVLACSVLATVLLTFFVQGRQTHGALNIKRISA